MALFATITLAGMIGANPVTLVSHDGVDYVYHTSKKTYSVALKDCEKAGATLAMPKTKESQRFVASTWPTERFWIGIDDLATKGIYYFVDGTLVRNTFWLSGEPNNLDGLENCVQMRNGGWNDSICTIKGAYLCQKGKIYLTLSFT